MIKINIYSQSLTHLRESEGAVKEYPISSSRFGIGFEERSNRTPKGNFFIFQKIGANEPINTVFKGRQPVGVWNGGKVKEELITSRILWLSGLDEENKNTKDRFIYIHGTNEEEKIGKPSSHGCIRMLNEDVVEIFDLVEENESVIIV